MSKKTILPYSDDFNPGKDDELRAYLRSIEWHPNSFTHLDKKIREIVNLEGENSTKKYTYPSRKNALLSIQLYEGQGPIDLKMVSNIENEQDKLFHWPSLDAERHGRLAAEFIENHCDGDTLKWLKVFVGSMHSELNSKHTDTPTGSKTTNKGGSK